MVAASAPERTVAELGLTEASRSNLESLPSQGLASYMVLEPVQAIYIGTFTSIDQASSNRHLVCLPSPRRKSSRMRCPPSGSFSLNGSSSGSSPGRSTESSRRAPCSWDIGGNCVSGAGNLIVEIADGNYQDCSTLYLAWTGHDRDMVQGQKRWKTAQAGCSLRPLPRSRHGEYG